MRNPLQHGLGGDARAHRIALGEGFLAFAEVSLDAGEHDLDAPEPTSEGLGKTHDDPGLSHLGRRLAITP